jgi:hypothetical protein
MIKGYITKNEGVTHYRNEHGRWTCTDKKGNSVDPI